MDDSPFRRLSAELRNVIYDLASQTEGGVFVELVRFDTRKLGFNLKACHPHPLALTEVCREMRSETLGAFIAVNKVSLLVPVLDGHMVQGRHDDWQFVRRKPLGAAAVGKTIRDWLDKLHSINRRELKTFELDIGAFRRGPYDADRTAAAIFQIGKAVEAAGIHVVVWLTLAESESYHRRTKWHSLSFHLSGGDVTSLREAIKDTSNRKRHDLESRRGADQIAWQAYWDDRNALSREMLAFHDLADVLEAMFEIRRKCGIDNAKQVQRLLRTPGLSSR